MKTLGMSAVLAISTITTHAQKISASQAKSHEGESESVCGIVASEHFAASSRGEPTFINLDSPYPRRLFTILIWEEDLNLLERYRPWAATFASQGV